MTLSLAEQLLLLGLHDDKGSVLSGSTVLNYGLAGAVLLELLFQKRVLHEGKVMRLASVEEADDSVLTQALKLMQASKKDRSPKYWVSRIAHKVKDLQAQITDQLVAKQILKREGRTVLWVFKLKRYPTANAGPELEIRERIRNIVLREHEPTETEIALISLMQACGLVNEVFDRKERREAKRKIKALTGREQVGKAVSAIVTEMTAAVTAAVTAATVAATASN